MSTAEELFRQYEDQIVPRSFNPGFVGLSFVVSLVGAASTLELINRRTSRNGLLNHLLLLSSAVTMGGIAIWCMHFVGNRAITLGQGQSQLQIVYSPGFTALSFFIPILVLLAAFIITGAKNKVSWWRITIGGALAGGAISGMHYLGDASIQNYTCVYKSVAVFGAVMIAVVASIVALALFFAFRASWTHSWWKRELSAIVLASAVSGMHWCAATGTQYRLKQLSSISNGHGSVQNSTVIVVICLSIGAALIMAGLAMYSTHVMRRSAHKAQQVVLAAAVFDRRGRILVSPDGLLPSEKITDTYLEKTKEDVFDVAHPLFHWMFQASRNWDELGSLIQGMRSHLARRRKSGRDGRMTLISDNGQLVEDYDVILREMFCIAASSLAERMKEPLDNVGILWDEILSTGAQRSQRQRQVPVDIDETQQVNSDSLTKTAAAVFQSRLNDADLGEKGEVWRTRQSLQQQQHGLQQDDEYGRGSLMMLVRQVEQQSDVERLEAAGFRFADVNQVSGIIGASMQIKSRNLRAQLADMALYAEESMPVDPSVHIGFFGMRARVGAVGFDVLVKKGARNQLPAIKLPLNRLESWQMDLLRKLDRTNVLELGRKLSELKMLSPREMLFASQLRDALEALRASIDDPLFDEATLTSKVVQIPCWTRTKQGLQQTSTMITLRLVVPIHASVVSPKCEFIPLSFFKVHQMALKDSPYHAVFSRSVHREISPIVNLVAPVDVVTRTRRRQGRRERVVDHLLRWLGWKDGQGLPVNAEGNPVPTDIGGKELSDLSTSNRSGSTIELWSSQGNSSQVNDSTKSLREPLETHKRAKLGGNHLGGIMISKEIKVDVREACESRGGASSSSGPGRHKATTSSVSARTGPLDRINIAIADKPLPIPPPPRISVRGFDLQGENVHAGTSLGSAAVESGERVTEVSTFVDELFALCLDERW